MAKSVKIFKSAEEQELDFLRYFFELTPSERLQALAKLRKLNNPIESVTVIRKVTIKKHFFYDQ